MGKVKMYIADGLDIDSANWKYLGEFEIKGFDELKPFAKESKKVNYDLLQYFVLDKSGVKLIK
jgi:hypothetical protein